MPQSLIPLNEAERYATAQSEGLLVVVQASHVGIKVMKVYLLVGRTPTGKVLYGR